MSPYTEDLFSLQTLVRSGNATTAEQKERIHALQSRLPATLTAHLLRQIATGRRGIAWVRNGVCGECHLRLPHAMMHVLASTHELMLCESCGAFIVIPSDEVAKLRATLKPRVSRVVRREPLVA